MPLYMVQAAYTAEAWAAMARQPEDREQAFRALVERVGGRVHSFYFCFGEYDVVATYEAPDEAMAAAVAVAANAAGHLKATKTTPLIATARAMEGMRTAGGLAYRAPSTLAARVEAALAADPRTAGAAVDVSAAGGEVTLEGAVRSAQVREAAEAVARAAAGAALVVNELVVNPSAALERGPALTPRQVPPGA